jgi:DNA-binding transcriptional LysR family regulator
MDRFRAMETFVAIADAGSFTIAANKLHVSPSVASRLVKELESHLGTRLLTRSTRMFRLTGAGTQYLAECRRLIADIVNAEVSAAGAHALPQGRLTIAAPASFGKFYVTPVVSEYLLRFPDVQVVAWFIDRTMNLSDDGVDVAFRIGKLPATNFEAVPVGNVRHVLCASPEYLDRYGSPERLDQLTDHRIILATGGSSSPEWRFFDGESPLAIRVRPRLTTTSDSAIDAAVAGLGITRLLSCQVADQLLDGSLKTVLAEFEPPALPVSVVHRGGQYVCRKISAFVDLAVDALRSDRSLN